MVGCEGEMAIDVQPHDYQMVREVVCNSFTSCMPLGMIPDRAS